MLRPALAAASLAALFACAKLPEDVQRPASRALTDTRDTRLGRALARELAAHPGRSGVLPLASGREAFAARALLADAAERSLDVQYYIWRADTSGTLLDDALWRAAERGVRVRLLLDDANTRGLDATLAALDAHPNIEVRLFNPFASRALRVGDLADFSRLNRRMHNKSFTADNQVAVVGGRNVGDEYFGAQSAVAFADLDLLLAGAAVREVSADFDAYWNSASAYPAASLFPPASQDGAEQQRAQWKRISAGPSAVRYLEALGQTPLVADMLSGKVTLQWVPARVVSDDPDKVRHPPERTELHMLPRLEKALGKPQQRLDLVSPYFVPTEEGSAALRALAERGVKVRVLTNSLAATDVSAVYAGYVKYREPLLRAGIRLYELKRSARPLAETEEDEEQHRRRLGGSSGASLHAKTFAVDGQRMFVGSFNFDPRSARLNTEMGVVVESPELAARLSALFDNALADTAYELRLTPAGEIEWIERTAAGEVRHATTPETGVLRRLWIAFLALLPIEWLL
jgi:putative cardiolipin synthase